MTATRMLVLTIATTVLATAGARPLYAQTCAGDCNGNGAVAVEEIILGVRIALGDAATSECLAVDDNGDGAVAVNELLAAVRRVLDGCTAVATPTGKATRIASTTPTSTPVPTAVDSAALAAGARVATDPLLRVFDLQETVLAAFAVSGRARRTARGGAPEVSGCQQFDCQLFGTQEVCCQGTEFSQTFDHCTFDDIAGQGSLTGQFAMSSTSSTLCSGALPRDASFVLTLDSFTHDVAAPDGGLLRTFHQYSERYDKGPAACTLSPQDFFGLGLRGTGERRLDGVLRRFETDGAGTVRQDFEIGVAGIDITIDGAESGDACNTLATLNGTISSADFRRGTQASVNYSGFTVRQDNQEDGSFLLNLSGFAATDCLGEVSVATTEPLRVERAATCFESGHLLTSHGESRLSSFYGDGGALDLDFDGDGNSDQHFARCTDVPTDACTTDAVAVCGACSTNDDCQRGTDCFPCSGDCAADAPRRCAFAGTFLACEDGVF